MLFTNDWINRLRHRIIQPTKSAMAELGREGAEVVKTPNKLSYAYLNRGASVLAVAHLDCVDHGSKHFHCQNGMVWSSRLDDRLGYFIVRDVLPALKIKVDLLLTDGEESGKSTAKHFKLPEGKKYNWIVQFDRRGDDCVVYCYDVMREPLKKYFDVGYGSYTDIRELDELGCGAFNVGCGYHQEHTLGSYAILSETEKNIVAFHAFWKANKKTHFPYRPYVWKGNQGYAGGGGWDNGYNNGYNRNLPLCRADSIDKTAPIYGDLDNWEYDAEAKLYRKKKPAPVVPVGGAVGSPEADKIAEDRFNKAADDTMPPADTYDPAVGV